MRCFVGALIRDEDYTPAIEGIGIWECSASTNAGKLLTEILAKNDVDSVKFSYFLRLLQSIHDSCDPAVWEERFNHVAKLFNLKYEPPTVN